MSRGVQVYDGDGHDATGEFRAQFIVEWSDKNDVDPDDGKYLLAVSNIETVSMSTEWTPDHNLAMGFPTEIEAREMCARIWPSRERQGHLADEVAGILIFRRRG